MRKLKFEDVKKTYDENLKKNGLYFQPGYPPKNDNFAKGVYVMLETLIDSINENLSWKGKTVAFKEQVILIMPHRDSITFYPGTEVKCILDKEEELKITHKGEDYTVLRKSFYLCEEE